MSLRLAGMQTGTWPLILAPWRQGKEGPPGIGQALDHRLERRNAFGLSIGRTLGLRLSAAGGTHRPSPPAATGGGSIAGG